MSKEKVLDIQCFRPLDKYFDPLVILNILKDKYCVQF